MTLFDPEIPAAPEPSVRVRAVVAYDGSAFHGFAENAGVRTIAGSLRVALEKVLGHRVSLTGAGRTDRGVHARGQVVSFDARAHRLDLVAVQRSLNKMLGPSIAVRAIEVAEPGFDARFSAVARVYRYRIRNHPVPDPLTAATSWHVAAALDLAAVRLATDPLIGEHDFSSFCRKPSPPPGGPAPSLQRRVQRARWTSIGDDLVQFEIEASSFCHQMVRSVVGTLVDIGLGRRKAAEMSAILAARDRNAAGGVAPPHGLVLWEVRY